MEKIRKKYIVGGQVQGVGFRPFIYTIALDAKLTGFVSNTRAGVFIEAQGSHEQLGEFEKNLHEKLPPLAEISSLKTEEIHTIENELDFQIHISETKGKGHAVLISPDVAHCEACKNEMLDKNDSRYLYPFINCTHCGPRYSITHTMPYDRETTSMACFPLCEDCQKEYTNPLDRRFHAQPTACHVCGVKVWNEENVENFDAIKDTISKLQQGKIVAIKGLGGFHLACDAMNIEAIERLRIRKNRPHKALAIMVKDIEKAKEFAIIDKVEEELLLSRQRPIVLCKKKVSLPHTLAPDTKNIGIMLPSSPLHELFFHAEHFDEKNFEALVMTSGNPAHEPISLMNREARAKLSNVADHYLFHNRDILVRVDDSVLYAKPENTREFDSNKDPFVSIRRARGYVPSPLSLPAKSETNNTHKNILAFGADLKGTACVTKNSNSQENNSGIDAFVGQHVGDIESMKNQEFLLETIAHLSKILEFSPEIVLSDAHPNSYSRLLAAQYAHEKNVKHITLQHHAAHAFALLADNQSLEPCIALVLDGTGYGLDNTFWGGELLYIDPKNAHWERIGHFKKTLQVANDRAVHRPWYMTQSFLSACNSDYSLAENLSIDTFELEAIKELISKNVGIQTSSCGRLFDAMGVLLSCISEITYEGQVPLQLESKQDFSYNDFDILPSYTEDELSIFDSHTLFNNCLQKKENHSLSDEEIARYFHLSLAHSLADWAIKACDKYNVKHIGMTGGVFLNKTLLEEVCNSIQKRNHIKNDDNAANNARNLYIPLLHKNFSPSDASLSLGQAFYASLLEK